MKDQDGYFHVDDEGNKHRDSDEDDIKAEEQSDKENEHYSDWYADKEDSLKEDYLMSFTHGELVDFILNDDGEFFEVHEQSFSDYCKEVYATEEGQ